MGKGCVRIDMSTVRAAAVQVALVAFDFEKVLEKAFRFLSEAAATGAGLVVFPEAFVSCFPRGLTFGATVGSRTLEGREDFRRYWESSVDVPPLGEMHTGPNFEEEATLIANLDLDEVAKGKYDFDVVGYHARPDVFQLSDNERSMTPVIREYEMHQTMVMLPED